MPRSAGAQIRTLVTDMPLTFPLQALLSRHEAYLAEAEAERRKMAASIDKLEKDKKEVEAANAQTIEENRYLLDQLEEINGTVANADAEISSLKITLESTRKELDRLTVLATKTSQLEAQLAAMEKEQDELQKQLECTEDMERTAIQRWKGAERTIGDLQEQIDRIEREAKEERARHTEVVARFERRRAVERELESAAGRLKGAAAATTLEKNGGNSVVSHFVKDILQDNANLQLGIVELRELLMGSNEEVENLREQMMLHQPVASSSTGIGFNEDLDSEITKTPTEITPDFHVHHHYHAAPVAKIAREKAVGLGRPKKRRHITTMGFRTPTTGVHTPRILNSPRMRPTPASSAATILSRTSVTIPASQSSHAHKWSMESSQAPSSSAGSSLPSSPSSAFQNMSLFDRMDDAVDSSRPTTPGSTTLGSPYLYPRRPKRDSDISIRSLSAQPPSKASQSIADVLGAADLDFQEDYMDNANFPLLEHSTILEEPEDDSAKCSLADDPDAGSNSEIHTSVQQQRPRLHRASSHESLLSSRGIDIPKLRGKGSQYLGNHGFTPRTSLGGSTASAVPVTSSTEALAYRANQTRGYNSSDYNRLLLGGVSTSPITADVSSPEKSTLGKRMGGWMLGKWGIAPAVSSGNLKAKDVLSTFDERLADKKQGGSTRSRKADNRLRTHIEAVNVDDALLQESLGGG